MAVGHGPEQFDVSLADGDVKRHTKPIRAKSSGQSSKGAMNKRPGTIARDLSGLRWKHVHEMQGLAQPTGEPSRSLSDSSRLDEPNRCEDAHDFSSRGSVVSADEPLSCPYSFSRY